MQFVFAQLETYRLDYNDKNKGVGPRSICHEQTRSVAFSGSSSARVKTKQHSTDEGLDHTHTHTHMSGAVHHQTFATTHAGANPCSLLTTQHFPAKADAAVRSSSHTANSQQVCRPDTHRLTITAAKYDG